MTAVWINTPDVRHGPITPISTALRGNLWIGWLAIVPSLVGNAVGMITLGVRTGPITPISTATWGNMWIGWFPTVPGHAGYVRHAESLYQDLLYLVYGIHTEKF